MNKQNKAIVPFQAYNLTDTADLIGMHPAALRRKLQEENRIDDPFIQRANPQKIGKEWRFMGENLLRALGSVSFQDFTNNANPNLVGGTSIDPKK